MALVTCGGRARAPACVIGLCSMEWRQRPKRRRQSKRKSFSFSNPFHFELCHFSHPISLQLPNGCFIARAGGAGETRQYGRSKRLGGTGERKRRTRRHSCHVEHAMQPLKPVLCKCFEKKIVFFIVARPLMPLLPPPSLGLVAIRTFYLTF